MDMGGHEMGMAPPTAAGAGGGMLTTQKHYTHMTFYWDWKSEILFTGWPGARGGMYALALVVVFALTLILELMGSRRLESRLPSASTGNRTAAGVARTAVYAVRMGVAYLLMLAVMSFNVGVLFVAMAGHAAGYLAFRAGLCGDGLAQMDDRCKEEAAAGACC